MTPPCSPTPRQDPTAELYAEWSYAYNSTKLGEAICALDPDDHDTRLQAAMWEMRMDALSRRICKDMESKGLLNA